MIVATVKLDTIKLNKLIGDIPARANKVLDKGAFEIQKQAILNTTRVDTGSMKNGWTVKSPDGSVVNAPGYRPNGKPEIDVAAPGEYKRAIYNRQLYAFWNEVGTVKMSASPMLVPAVEQYRQKITDAWKKLFEGE
jgi:Bacteriophage HK97-gp10, putative tail-component